MDEQTAEQLVRPAQLIAIGERLGDHLGTMRFSPALSLLVAGASHIATGAVRILHEGLRPGAFEGDRISLPDNTVPLLGLVVVIGGGTGGAPAFISAGEKRTSGRLVCEHMPVLGGVGTAGQIANYYYGNLGRRLPRARWTSGSSHWNRRRAQSPASTPSAKQPGSITTSVPAN